MYALAELRRAPGELSTSTGAQAARAGRHALVTCGTRISTARTVPARHTAPGFVGSPSALSTSAIAASVAPERRSCIAPSAAAASSEASALSALDRLRTTGDPHASNIAGNLMRSIGIVFMAQVISLVSCGGDEKDDGGGDAGSGPEQCSEENESRCAFQEGKPVTELCDGKAWKLREICASSCGIEYVSNLPRAVCDM